MSKLTTTELSRIDALLKKASSEDLKLIRDMFNYNSRNKMATVANNFRNGDRVAFTGKRGETLSGTVMKVNRKTVKVNVGSVVWTVTPTLLRKA